MKDWLERYKVAERRYLERVAAIRADETLSAAGKWKAVNEAAEEVQTVWREMLKGYETRKAELQAELARLLEQPDPRPMPSADDIARERREAERLYSRLMAQGGNMTAFIDVLRGELKRGNVCVKSGFVTYFSRFLTLTKDRFPASDGDRVHAAMLGYYHEAQEASMSDAERTHWTKMNAIQSELAELEGQKTAAERVFGQIKPQPHDIWNPAPEDGSQRDSVTGAWQRT